MSKALTIIMTKKTTLNRVVETQLRKWINEQSQTITIEDIPEMINCECDAKYSSVLERCPDCGKFQTELVKKHE